MAESDHGKIDDASDASQGGEKILVVTPAWIGDMVMAQALFLQLKKLQPHCCVDALAPPAVLPLLRFMPQLRQSFTLDLQHGELGLRRRWKLGRRLKTQKYDRAVVLPNSLKSALIPFFAGIPQRTGWRGEHRYGLLNDLRTPCVRHPLREADRFAMLAHPAGAGYEPAPRPALQVDASQARRVAEQLGLSDARPVLALCVGAEYGPAKRWPVRHFATVAADWSRKGGQTWLLGSKKECALSAAATEILEQEQRAHCHDLVGRTSLTDAVLLLSRAAVVLSNDSGLMHAAAALQKPVAALYGPTSPERAPPLCENAEILSLRLPCSPCRQRQCPLQHHNCMQNLSPEMVLEALRTLRPGTARAV